MSSSLTANGLPLELEQLATSMKNFIFSLLELPQGYAASTLGNRLLVDQQHGRAHLARSLEWLGHYVEITPMPESLRLQLRGELIRARIHGENEKGSPAFEKLTITADEEQHNLANINLALNTSVSNTSTPIDFASYIKNEYREKLLPFLKKKYTCQKSKAVACMLLALHDLGVLKESPHMNKSQLHESLTVFFGKVGTRQALSNNLKNLEHAKGNEHLQIEAHRESILELLNQE